MFVARFTFTPEYDVQRNWSAWMGMDFDTKEAAYESVAETQLGDTIEEAWEKWQDEEFQTWHKRQHGSRIDFLEDNVNADIRYNEAWKKWQVVHHDGLSCWSLDAESVEDAVKEAKDSNLMWYGFGSHTVGKVSYICAVDGIEYLHIFECEDTSIEI